MEKDKPPGDSSQSARTLDNQMQHLNLTDAAQAETPEAVRFRSLPQATQQRLLLEYPRILATAVHQYSQGDDCESVLLRAFEDSSEMLRVRNSNGDNPLAVALLRDQSDRAGRLMELAARVNPAALDDRSQYHETLLMLSTSSSSAASLMEQLLIREPTQLHRLYDNDGRNFLHHCALEKSPDALEAALRLTAQLMQEGRLDVGQVSAAVHMNDRSGDTPMHMMAGGNRRDMLSQLVQFAREAGININLDERQHRGNRWTPMMAAVGAGAADAVEFLLDNGADPTEEDGDGHTVIDMAAGNARLMQLFTAVNEDEHVEVAGAAAAPVGGGVAGGTGETWLNPVRTVDSGTGTCGDLATSLMDPASVGPVPAPSGGPAEASLSEAEILLVEQGLFRQGKEAAFLDAFSGSHATQVMLARMTEHPVMSLISNLAHERQCRSLVRGALRAVGEPQLGGSL